MTTRDELLRAAETVVAQSGSRALTLDAVAAQAGVSKGGLLYHFPNKRALIMAMVAQAVDGFEAGVQASVDAGADWLSAYVEATLSDVSQPSPLSGVLAAVAEDPQLLEPFRAALDNWYRRALDRYGVAALPLLLALDGLWFHAQIGTAPGIDAAVVGLSLRRLAASVSHGSGHD